MSQAFISYHRAQSKLARLIAHRVAADGHSVWWDRSDRPGDQWSEAVATALANSACVIVLWSRQSVTSPIILGEATAGYGREALVSVLADKTPAPSPFDKSPVIDMHDWEGESADLSWIRLREPLRDKLTKAERQAVENAPLPPARPQPVRVGFSSTAMPPPPAVEYHHSERRGGSPASTLLTLLALGGLGTAGWVYRDELRVEAQAWRLALTTPAPAPTMVAEIPDPAPPPPTPAAEPLTPVDAEPPAAAVAPAAEAEPPAPAPAVARARDSAPVPQMTITYEQWRDGAMVAPVQRAPPRPPAAVERPRAASLEIPAPPPVVAPGAPAATSRLVALPQGQAIDIDRTGVSRSDLWFAPDRSGYGLFLGVTNGARARVVRADKATALDCTRVMLNRAPVAAREVVREGGVCVRSSDGTLSAWRVERLERTARGTTVLQLRPVGS